MLSILLLAISVFIYSLLSRHYKFSLEPFAYTAYEWGIISFACVMSVYVGSLFSSGLLHFFDENASVFISTSCIQVLGISFIFYFLYSLDLLKSTFKNARFWLGALSGFKYFLISIPVIVLSAYLVNVDYEFITGQKPPLQDVVEMYASIESLYIKVLATFTIVILAPILEELLFRVLLYRGFLSFFKSLVKSYADLLSAIITSLLFALIHFSVFAFIPIFIMSLFLIYSYKKTDNIYTPIYMHIFFNALNVIGIFIEAGNV